VIDCILGPDSVAVVITGMDKKNGRYKEGGGTHV